MSVSNLFWFLWRCVHEARRDVPADHQPAQRCSSTAAKRQTVSTPHQARPGEEMPQGSIGDIHSLLALRGPRSGPTAKLLRLQIEFSWLTRSRKMHGIVGKMEKIIFVISPSCGGSACQLQHLNAPDPLYKCEKMLALTIGSKATKLLIAYLMLTKVAIRMSLREPTLANGKPTLSMVRNAGFLPLQLNDELGPVRGRGHLFPNF